MELNDLKSGWKNAGGYQKTEEDLKQMTKIVNHPVIKRIKTKLVIQTVAMLVILFVYYDWFDGDKKPVYANLALLAGLLLYIVNDVAGYFLLTRPVGSDNLKQSVEAYLTRVKRFSFCSLGVSLLYSSSIMIFFTSAITFTKEKWWILLFATIIMVQLIIFSSKLWLRWIKKLKQQVKDFNVGDNRTA